MQRSHIKGNKLKPIKVVFYAVLPSPYQCDLFYALSCCTEVDLQVYYLESGCTDSPWTQKPLQPYEKVLPGFHIAWGLARFHLNWHIPNLHGVDLIILNGYQSLTSQLLLRLYAGRIPTIFWGEKMTGGSSDGIKGRLQQVLSVALNRCCAIAAIGSRAQQDYQQRFPFHAIFNIPYYCDLSKFQTKVERPRSPITILFCGQMIERKGVDLLLQAFEQLIQSGTQARLLLVGREAELPEMMRSLSPKTQQQIDYAGFHDPEYLPQFFEQADIFVLPSRYDGWGVVVNQALGAGLPIVCSDAVGAAVDLVEPGINGAIVPAGDAIALSKALSFYTQSPEVLQHASEASRRKAVDWTPEAGAAEWCKAFSRTIERKSVRQQPTTK